MAGSKIKGIIVEIGGDTSGLQKALSKVNSATSSLSKELRGINSLLKLDPTNVELLTQKQEVLNDEITLTSQKLEELKKHQEEVKNSGKTLNEEQEKNYRALQREIINTENKLKNLKLEASNWTVVGRAIEEVGAKIENIGSRIDNLGNKLTTRLTIPLLTAGVIGVNSAAKQEAAIQQVELIYGDAVDSIQDFAENTAISYNMSTKAAYQYAQIYGNLIQSITDDEEENALYTQQLLKASSVIASATGRTMEDVMDRIRSGLLGNTEAIEDLGVNVNVSLLESTDAFRKFAGDKSWNQLDFKTQQQIRLFGILEQTTKKYGDEVNKNTASNIQRLTAKFSNLTNKLNQKLLPVANKLIDKADKFIDKLDNLSEEELENIINIGLIVAAAGPLIKILSTTINISGKTAKGIGVVSQAIAVLKTGAESSSKSVNNLAKGLKAITSPAGIATGALAAFAVGVAIVKNKVDEEYESLTNLNNELKNSIETRNLAMQSIEEMQNASLAEIVNTEKLKNELSLLVDENGKVKEGCQTRAQFILGELNKALGTEYELNNDIIDSYKEMQGSIDELILKKKAQIILEANEEKYKEAIQNKTKLLEEHIKAVDNLNQKEKRFNELQKEWSRGFIGSKQSLVENISEMNKLSEEIVNLRGNISGQMNQINDYNTAISDYQKNSELMLAGGAENLKKIEQSVASSQQNITNLANASLSERISAQIAANQYSQRLYNLDVTTNKEAKDSIYSTNVEEGKKQLSLLTQELITRTNTVEELGEEEKNAWKTLANESYEEYSSALSKLGPTTSAEIQDITGVLLNDENVKYAAEDLAGDVNSGFNDNINGKKWGEDAADEIAGGMTNSTSRQKITDAALKVAGWISDFLHFTVPEKGPLSDMDKSMPDMIDLMADGIYSNKHKLVNAANRLAKDLDDKLFINGNVNLANLERIQNGIASRTIDRTRTIFTTPTLNIYTQGEINIREIAEEVNRVFGSQY